ncbi:Molybdate-binding protein [Fundidesulfovibrio magnetotacticus]|uniref:Molybdate-binding protein n=1 Tax=Fundidesulfovibrio magnetotacticus TaxID=2730080 RepID=A0A6V8LQS2_9BACT|nr:substrate-binding domain-containing protein [Fundidesulfovibrio magnetotacticus]GFK92688.1 Molybdate-binding protein [Fundidesulfovibrio magnetotacticus]
MDEKTSGPGRRLFLKTLAGSAAALAGAAAPAFASGRPHAGSLLQVWSCGGLAEAMNPANALYEESAGIRISYTGAFAAALGKSLLGSSTTEVFAGRVLDLAKKLRQAGKMTYFKPLCFTSYVMVTPRGNPAGIRSVEDMARPGVRVVLAPEASPPGGAAAVNLLKKAGVHDAAMKNCVVRGSCVQRVMDDVIAGRGDVSIVELRVTRIPLFEGRMDVVAIPEALFPPPPLTFTVGVMKDAKNRALADDYVNFLTSPEGQAYFERAGFIPAFSDKGKELVDKLGVKDA